MFSNFFPRTVCSFPLSHKMWRIYVIGEICWMTFLFHSFFKCFQINCCPSKRSWAHIPLLRGSLRRANLLLVCRNSFLSLKVKWRWFDSGGFCCASVIEKQSGPFERGTFEASSTSIWLYCTFQTTCAPKQVCNKKLVNGAVLSLWRETLSLYR